MLNKLQGLGLKWILVALGALAPIKGAIITMLALIVIDFITGSIASVKAGNKWSSARARDTISKFLIYLTVVILGYFTQTYLIGNLVPVESFLTALIGLVEFKSVLENCEAILGTSTFDNLISKLGSSNIDQIKHDVVESLENINTSSTSASSEDSSSNPTK